jgi:hypothetical protein
MGQVIAMQGWLERRERPDAPADDVARLERAVARLEPLLDGRGTHPAGLGLDLETELLAVSGAVSLGLYTEAARRAERLADRLGSRQRGHV